MIFFEGGGVIRSITQKSFKGGFGEGVRARDSLLLHIVILLLIYPYCIAIIYSSFLKSAISLLVKFIGAIPRVRSTYLLQSQSFLFLLQYTMIPS